VRKMSRLRCVGDSTSPPNAQPKRDSSASNLMEWRITNETRLSGRDINSDVHGRWHTIIWLGNFVWVGSCKVWESRDVIFSRDPDFGSILPKIEERNKVRSTNEKETKKTKKAKKPARSHNEKRGDAASRPPLFFLVVVVYSLRMRLSPLCE